MSSDLGTHGRYYPAIDGLRTLAVGAVVAYHGDRSTSPGGFLGVDVFFVISGFVITLTLLREHERTNAISLSAFYLRRFWRLTPAMVLAVIVGAIACFGWGIQSAKDFVLQAGAALTYTYNLATVAVDNRGGGILSHLWSLAVEEQFYIVWAPLLAYTLGRLTTRAARAQLMVVGIVIFFAARVLTYLAFGDLAAFFLPWARFDQFAIGALIALLMHHASGSTPSWVRSQWPALAALAVLVAAVAKVSDLTDEWLFLGGYTACAVLAGVLVSHGYSGARTALNGFLGSTVMVWLGQRSYGIYLYHYPVGQALDAMGIHDLARVGLSFAVAVAMAAVSKTYIEDPLRKRGQRTERPATHRG